jgi:hypothetical protein
VLSSLVLQSADQRHNIMQYTEVAKRYELSLAFLKQSSSLHRYNLFNHRTHKQMRRNALKAPRQTKHRKKQGGNFVQKFLNQ